MVAELLEKEVVVKNERGIHARPAALIAQLANSKNANLVFLHDGEEVDCHSVLSLLMMAAGCGTHLVLRADGPDAQSAFDALLKLFEDKFNEE